MRAFDISYLASYIMGCMVLNCGIIGANKFFSDIYMRMYQVEDWRTILVLCTDRLLKYVVKSRVVATYAGVSISPRTSKDGIGHNCPPE